MTYPLATDPPGLRDRDAIVPLGSWNRDASAPPALTPSTRAAVHAAVLDAVRAVAAPVAVCLCGGLIIGAGPCPEGCSR